MPSLLLYALFPRVKQKELTSFTIHRLALDVYSFNPSAEKVYLKAGFKREGVLRDAIMDGDKYTDDILMSILEDEWRALKTDRNTEGDLQ